MRKICVIFMAAILLSSAAIMAACQNQPQGTEGTLSIASFEGGYGDTWASALAQAYKQQNPEIDVVVDTSPLVRDDAVTALQTGVSSVDLFFIDGASIGTYCEVYDTLAELNEVYESKPKAGGVEEDIFIKDKLRPEIVQEMTYGGDREPYVGNYYTVPTPSGPNSLILNVDALNLALGEGNWEVPVTTDEMMNLADRIKAANATVNVAGINHTIYPFIYSGDAVEYLRYLSHAWVAQHDGAETFRNSQSYKIDGKYNQAAFNPPGKLIAYTAIERILKRANNYCDPSSMGNKPSASQKYFFQNRAAMYITGDWLEREMEAATEYHAELIMVKPPVISALSQKLETEYSVNLGATAAVKDQKLAEIIDAVDAGETSLEGVSQQVFDAVKESRSIIYSLANNAIGFMPRSSVNKELAIDFLRFMYSDEGIAIVMRESKSNLPIAGMTYESSANDSNFRKSVMEIESSGVQYIFSSSRDPIRYRAGVDEYIGNEKPEIAFGKRTGALTAAQQLQKEISALADSWSEYMEYVE